MIDNMVQKATFTGTYARDKDNKFLQIESGGGARTFSNIFLFQKKLGERYYSIILLL